MAGFVCALYRYTHGSSMAFDLLESGHHKWAPVSLRSAARDRAMGDDGSCRCNCNCALPRRTSHRQVIQKIPSSCVAELTMLHLEVAPAKPRASKLQQPPYPVKQGKRSGNNCCQLRLRKLSASPASFIDRASCKGCCCRRSTTSFHSLGWERGRRIKLQLNRGPVRFAAKQLALMLHTLKLRLNVLLRDLQKTKNAVVSLLCNHILSPSIFRHLQAQELTRTQDGLLALQLGCQAMQLCS